MTDNEDNNRLDSILEMIANIAALDFSKSLNTSDKHDMIDAIALGLNMLSEELNTQVVARAKLDEVNQKLKKFAYTTAHDLKSPLNSQSLLIYLLNASVESDDKEETKLLLSKLMTVNEEMKKLVSGILDYSLQSSTEINKVEIDLEELLSEIIETGNYNSKLDVSMTTPLPFFKYNQTAFRQIIQNLIDNAVKYCERDKCKVTIDYKEFDEEFEFSIMDNGPGIETAYQEKIFDLFGRVDKYSNNQNSGIGLATVKSIIESNGGKIWVNSKLGEGSRFTFTVLK